MSGCKWRRIKRSFASTTSSSALPIISVPLAWTTKVLFGLPSSEQESLRGKLESFVRRHARVLEDRHFELKVWALVTAALLQPRGTRGVYLQELQQNETSSTHYLPVDMIGLAREMIWVNILESPSVDNLLEEMELNNFQIGNERRK